MSFTDGAIALLVLLGVLTGLVSGMLGVGGGGIVVPALIFGLPHFGAGGPDVPKIAMATSLALIIPTSIASAQSHAAKGAIDWGMAGILAPGIVAGAYITGAFAAGLNTRLVMLVFVAFAIFTAWGLIRPRHITLDGKAARPCIICMSVKSVLGGALSALLGLGVAFFAVPLLARLIPVQRAIGTAGALALPAAVAGTAGYLIADTPAGCAACSGYVFLPAVAAIGISAVLAAPAGVWAAHTMPVAALRRLFAAFLIFAASSLAYKALTPAALTADIARLLIATGQLWQPRAAPPIAANVPQWMQGGAGLQPTSQQEMPNE